MIIPAEQLIIAVVSLVLGLFIGLALRAPAARKAAVLRERLTGVERDRAMLQAEAERLTGELKARDAQIRPLADELDRMRRDFNKARRAEGASDVAIDLGNLALLKGVGPKFADRLVAVGITSIGQIAGWTSADAQVMDSQMGDFKGRIESDRLIEQARLLNEGRVTEYETKFGKIG